MPLGLLEDNGEKNSSRALGSNSRNKAQTSEEKHFRLARWEGQQASILQRNLFNILVSIPQRKRRFVGRRKST
jgi:hypothetical protein